MRALRAGPSPERMGGAVRRARGRRGVPGSGNGLLHFFEIMNNHQSEYSFICPL